MGKTRVVVYTAIFGGYDILRDPKWPYRNVHYRCFTEEGGHTTEVWNVIVQPLNSRTNARAARYRKIMAHAFVPDADYSLWIDSNIQLVRADVLGLCEELLAEHDIAVFEHPERDCVHQEARANIILRKEFPQRINRQVNRYRLEGYPEHHGMVETGVLFRRHNKRTREFNEAWWQEIVRETHRDQLSFNYVCWKLGIGYRAIPGNARLNRCLWLCYIGHGVGKR